ncbi:MAG TPA: SGNH/GDSL hydrolase family protein [Puia sp.]|nr:SGNH/GDSL hydrolase family protein [Puia sp.]
MKEHHFMKWLALGDSYTIGESVSASERYPVQAVRKLEIKHIHFKDPKIIATTGWTTADLLSAIQKQEMSATYDIVSLLIGVNNQYQQKTESEYREQFTELLQKSIQFSGNRPSHVIVLSIPDYSVTPFAHDRDRASITKQIDSFNLINKTLSAVYQVNYLDITEESRKAAGEPSFIAADGLHFSGKEYAIWADRLVTLIERAGLLT